MVQMAKNIKKKRLLLEDNPIEAEDMDKFGHSIFVSTLFELIQDTEKSCNIALFGKWGAGKTSIINMLFNRIKNNKTVSRTTKCFYFDTWKYSDESIMTEFLIELDEQFENPIGKDTILDILYNIKEDVVTDKKNISKRIRDFFSNSKIFWVSLIVIIVIDLFIFFFSGVGAAYIITASFIVPLFAELISKIHSATISVRKRFILPKKELTGEFENLFRKIISEIKAKKVILAIDNLDRCQDHVVIQMLALFKTFMNDPNCIFIIPCDDEAILSHINAIDKERGYFTKNGQEFLRKIFQIRMKIPPFLNESLEEYAKNLKSQMQFQFDDNVQDVIISAHVKNPRRMIHAFNRLTTLYLLARKKEEARLIRKGIITDNLSFLAKISIIEDEWKDFYDDLSYNIFLLDDIEMYFRGMPPSKEIQEKIRKHFNSNPELRAFLNATRVVRVDDVEPFLLLSQETYERTIPERERLRNYLYENNVNQVYDIIRKTPDTRKSDYVKSILKTCDNALKNKKYILGFNCLNILSYIYEVLPDEFHSEVACKLGKHFNDDGIIDFLSSFDMEKLFKILPHMEVSTRDNTLCNFMCSLFSSDYRNSTLLSKLIERSDLVGKEAKKNLNTLLREKLDSEQSEIVKEIIQRILKNKIAEKNLLEPETLIKYQEKIEEIEEKEKEQLVSMIRILVKLPLDGETTIDISPNATFKDLIKKASAKLQFNPQNKIVMFQGKKQLSDMSLSKAGVRDGDSVFISE